MASDAGDRQWPDRAPLPRWAFWLMLPGIVAPVLIFGFIIWTKQSHDPARCPFRELSQTSVAANIALIEEARSCVSGIEERRYTLVRDGQRRLLGERSFDSRDFAPGRYSVKAELVAQGELQLVVHNAGHDDVLFREGTASEHERGVSLEHRSARDLARARAAQARAGSGG